MVATFEYDIFKCILTDEKCCISFRISLTIVKGPIDNKAELVQIIAWRRTCEKPSLMHRCSTRWGDDCWGLLYSCATSVIALHRTLNEVPFSTQNGYIFISLIDFYLHMLLLLLEFHRQECRKRVEILQTVFKLFCVIENTCFSVEITLKYFHEGPICFGWGNAWCHTDGKRSAIQSLQLLVAWWHNVVATVLVNISSVNTRILSPVPGPNNYRNKCWSTAKGIIFSENLSKTRWFQSKNSFE